MDPENTTEQELKLAIAASLRDLLQDSEANSAKGGEKDVVDLTVDSDDDELQPVHPKSKSVIGSETDANETGDEYGSDEDLRRAIELSLQQFEDTGETPDDTRPPSQDDNKEHDVPDAREIPAADKKPSQLSSLLGLNRKQMEEERLLRAAKRRAEDAESIDHRQIKHSKTEPTSAGSSGTKRSFMRAPIPNVPHTSRARATESKSQIPQPSRTPGAQFLKGIVKKTYAQYCPRIGDDIMIEEVFQKNDLELAVLSSFIWDMEWLFSKLDTKHTRFLLVMQAKDDATKRQYEAETASMGNLRLCFPPMEGQVNCMHSKLMLLFHPGYLRIVIPTANLTPYDWGEIGGVMENSVFLIDLPRRLNTDSSKGSKTPFFEDLVFFLGASHLHENVITKLDGYDFSQTAHIMLVHTIGGSHIRNYWKRTGFCGLGRAVNALGLRTSKPINVDFVTSSVGSLTDEFLRSIYLAAQGDDGMTEFLLRTAKSFPVRNPTDTSLTIDKTTGEECKNRFRVYYPSQTTIQQSRGGPNCAGTICFQSKWYENAKFPRQVLRDCKSRRTGLLMHNKMIFVKPDEPIRLPDNSQCRAWAYIGSANLSESAWGRLVQDRSTKQPKLNCRNWECGVLIPIIEASTGNEASGSADKNRPGESAGMLDVFTDKVPVPMTVPGLRYGPGLRPWFL